MMSQMSPEELQRFKELLYKNQILQIELPSESANVSPPEKRDSKTRITLPVRMAQIILRDDNGPTDRRSIPENFFEFRSGKFIDLKFLDTVPAYHAGQLEFCDE